MTAFSGSGLQSRLRSVVRNSVALWFGLCDITELCLVGWEGEFPFWEAGLWGEFCLTGQPMTKEKIITILLGLHTIWTRESAGHQTGL